ncbi:hypothetical protein Mpt1_c04380 [Candidatus Methanoplasma termitum]|uniref:Uncharacterized protein n=1 Tax=Candidatus Methanoplasma termitum TaxID=1577791 RepID=A0A0A7LFQ2_9ARCH|nr:hypothetical protein [Candidatus Methanoplasma termitum]AIZ56331.1 hypothetical protein Mpt1_c04380 [Candidatus Methanoplasma termitum]MCL2333628.1 hypothetical protein [Candidatus Methanoplasma sp.]
MDGNIDIRKQVVLLRSVIGRKIMEIDELEDKLTVIKGDEADQYLNMIDFLKKDIIGYKTIVDDLKDGSNDLSGYIEDIATLPPDSVRIYNDMYLPALSDEDRIEDNAAMDIKIKYVQDLRRANELYLGRMALTDPKVLDVMLADEELVRLIGNIVMETPEYFDIILKQL